MRQVVAAPEETPCHKTIRSSIITASFKLVKEEAVFTSSMLTVSRLKQMILRKICILHIRILE